MSAFVEIEGAYIVTHEAGVFRQVPAFERNGVLFAKQKGGFVRLQESKRTSHAKVRWEEISGVCFRVAKWDSLEVGYDAK